MSEDKDEDMNGMLNIYEFMLMLQKLCDVDAQHIFYNCIVLKNTLNQTVMFGVIRQRSARIQKHIQISSENPVNISLCTYLRNLRLLNIARNNKFYI